MTIAETIDNLLAKQNMSRRQLAIKAGIPPSTLQSAMARNKDFSLDMLLKIANALGVSLDTLLTIKPLPAKEIPITSYFHETTTIEEPDQLSIAFERFMSDIGYIAQLNALGFKDNHGELNKWIIYNRRDDVAYFISSKDLEHLQNSVVSYTKYQIYELLQHAEKLNQPQLGELKLFNGLEIPSDKNEK